MFIVLTSNVAEGMLCMRCCSSFIACTVTGKKSLIYLWYLIFLALLWLHIAFRHQLYRKRVAEIGVILKKKRVRYCMSSLKPRVKVCGANISCVTWASTLQCSAFKACLPVCSLTEFSGPLSPAAGLMMRSQTPTSFQEWGASISTRVVLSWTPMGPSQTGQGRFCLDTARIILMGAI